MIDRGQLTVHFDRLNGGEAGMVWLRSDEHFRQLRAFMSFGMVDLE